MRQLYAYDASDANKCTRRLAEDRERLPFVWKPRKFRAEFKCFIPVEIFRKKRNIIRVITFFSVFTETTEIFCTICWITSARLHVQRKRKFYQYFVNGTTLPVPVFGAI